jgi:OmpA-OmpF porin, OOP family
MKRVWLSLLVLALVAAMGVPAHAAEGYFSGTVGIVALMDSEINDGAGELSFDLSFGILGAFGHYYDNGLRSEIELGFRRNDLDKIKINGWTYRADGEITALSLMFNLYYDFARDNGFSPFIGLGIGGANIFLNEWDSDHANVLAYQAAIGGSIAASKELHIDLQYRFFGTTDPDFGEVEMQYMSHNLLVSLRKSF